MAVKTIRRNPMQVNTDDYYDDLNEGYFNFTSFNGINSKQNYISIDQQSFEDAKNVYLDQNAQLSTRPIVKTQSILPVNEQIVQIIKINNLVIYHTCVNDNYKIRFYMANSWQSYDVGEKVCVSWIYDKYFVFTNNSIFAFSYDFDTDTIVNYGANDIIYTPIKSGNDPDSSQEDNVFTSSYITNYVFEAGTTLNIPELVGENITIDIDGENFSLTPYIENNNIVFTKSTYTLEIHDKEVSLTLGAVYNNISVSRTLGNFICTNDDMTQLYYSIDGKRFFEITPPDIMRYDTGGPVLPYFYSRYCISDDGTSLYFIPAYMPNGNLIVYEMELSDDFMPTYWTKIYDDALPTLQMNCDVPYTSGDYTAVSVSLRFTEPSITPLCISSPEKGVVAIYADATYSMLNNYNSELLTSESGAHTYKSPVSTGVEMENCDEIYVLKKNNSNLYELFSTRLMQNYITRVDAMWYDVINNYAIIGCGATRLYMIPVHENTSYPPSGKIVTGTVSVDSVRNLYFATLHYDTAINVLPGSVIYEILSDFIYTSYGASSNIQLATGNNNTQLVSINITNIQDDIVSSAQSRTTYAYTYSYTSTLNDGDRRSTIPWSLESTSNTVQISTISCTKFYLAREGTLLTENFIYYNNQVIPLLNRTENRTPIFVDDNGTLLYYESETNKFYSNDYDGQIYATVIVYGDINYLLPDRIVNFIGATNINVFSVNNKLYWTSSEGEAGKLYVPLSNVIEFDDIITNFAVFSQTSLGVFLEDSVYEFMYDTSNSVYRLASTKLQLGCKKDADVLVSYDGSTIYLSTVKGLSGLTYQDFVQSTEQVYSYLTDNILDMYDDYYENGPIKLYQYKYWLFMYRKDTTIIFVYDTRNQSWWKWEFIYPIQQIVYANDSLIVLMNGTTYRMYHNNTIYDDDVLPFDWYILSQKLHFNAPNYYKHIRQLAVITSQDGATMRYKLGFKNYRNLNNLVDNDTVEYNIEQLNTLIKRVSFMKTNAFQFSISKDDTDKHPSAFVVPDIAIKYRVTEAIR